MKYIASWSGGKDSTASIILAHEHNEPLKGGTEGQVNRMSNDLICIVEKGGIE